MSKKTKASAPPVVPCPKCTKPTGWRKADRGDGWERYCSHCQREVAA